MLSYRMINRIIQNDAHEQGLKRLTAGQSFACAVQSVSFLSQ